MIRTLLHWHLLSYLRRGGELFSLLMIYLLLTTVLVLAQPATAELSVLSHGLLWLLALLSLALALHQLYEREAQDGLLEQWRFLSVNLETIVMTKMLVHWLLVGLPVTIAAPVIALLLGAHQVTWQLAGVLMLGTCCFTALGSLAAAASLRQRSKQLVTLILVFPLAIPLVIFGVPAGAGGGSELLLLLAYVAFITPLSIIGSAALLRFQ